MACESEELQNRQRRGKDFGGRQAQDFYIFQGGKLETECHMMDLIELVSPNKITLTIKWKMGKATNSVTLGPICYNDFTIDRILEKIEGEFNPNCVGIIPSFRYILIVQPEARLHRLQMKTKVVDTFVGCGGFIRSYVTICNYHKTPLNKTILSDLSDFFFKNKIQEFILGDYLAISWVKSMTCVRQRTFPIPITVPGHCAVGAIGLLFVVVATSVVDQSCGYSIQGLTTKPWTEWTTLDILPILPPILVQTDVDCTKLTCFVLKTSGEIMARSLLCGQFSWGKKWNLISKINSPNKVHLFSATYWKTPLGVEFHLFLFRRNGKIWKL
eukprot:TRINITY_DN6608_c0_g1_i10.p1 TRINITY_DN6608_c0_g1~~TRINITY_DN6608_c0_g1_i10.p1  ORF type:complete len:328 (-),score=57.24 TRINITY_DN6608_c0_g1_i10:44-1027(-)